MAHYLLHSLTSSRSLKRGKAYSRTPPNGRNLSMHYTFWSLSRTDVYPMLLIRDTGEHLRLRAADASAASPPKKLSSAMPVSSMAIDLTCADSRVMLCALLVARTTVSDPDVSHNSLGQKKASVCRLGPSNCSTNERTRGREAR